MFGNLFSNAINAVKSFLGGNKAPAVKAAPKPTASKPNVQPLIKTQTFAPIAPIPALSIAPIARWGESKASVAARTAAWQASPELLAQQNWQKNFEAEQAKKEAERQRKIAQDKFDKTKADYKGRAQKTVDDAVAAQKQSLWSKITGGFTAESGGRKFAQEQADRIARDQTVRYDNKLNSFLKDQAKRKAEIESKKFSSQAEFDQAVGLFTKWESEKIDDLEYTRAASEGMSEGYTGKSQAESKSIVGKVGGWFNKNIVQGAPGKVAGGIWDYTLGQGSKEVPSLITAPARAMNAATNLFRKPGDQIFDKNGVPRKYDGNPWTASFDQANLNNKAATLSFDDYARNKYLAAKNPAKFGDTSSMMVGPKPAQKFDQAEFDKWKAKNKASIEKEWQTSTQNTKDSFGVANDWALDPVSYATGGAGKVGGWLGKGAGAASDAAKTTKFGAGLFSTADKIAKSKPVQWLGKEHMDVRARKDQFIKEEIADIERKKPLVAAEVKKWLDNKNTIKANEKGKIAQQVFSEYGGMSRGDIKTFQRLVQANGDWDLVKNAAKYNDGQREELDMLLSKWKSNTDKMQKMENAAGIATPYRSNYVPQYRKKYSLTRLTPKPKKEGDAGAPDWWFTKEQKRQSIQGKRSFIKSVAARQYYSQLARQDMPVLRNFKAGHEDLGRNIERIQNVDQYVKKTKWEKAMTPFSASTGLWKKAVLKYRPAWAVNNAAYNTQAGVLAGGAGSLVEQAKMLRPKNWKKAMEDLPEGVASNLSKQIGKDKISDFHTGVENWSRVASYRAMKKRGVSDDDAIKRINKYMFDYTTKNWERPLKAVMPFWAWNKNLTKAAATMPFDRPLAAKAYNGVDQYQQNRFDAEFEKVVPELTELGYTEDEIQKIKADQAKYFKGRLKVGDKWITTPFNAFSEKGLTGLGFNPYATALGESATATDSFGRKIGGKDATLTNRVLTKFPQIELGRQAFRASGVAWRGDKPRAGWIGEKGSEGYGLTKEKQGFDKSKSNYVESMDPRAKMGTNALAFLGVPRGMEFDTDKLVQTKKLQKTTEAYFKLDTKNMEFADAEKARQAVFDKYGITADEFYKGVLSKYDTDNTTRIKGMKESAAAANKKLFAEYAAQPEGTRNIWASKKLRQLVDSGYFADNPFKKSFSWTDPNTIAKAEKQELGQEAARTGDWSKYREKYGATQKQKDYEYAKQTGDWSKWRSKYGTTSQKAADYAAAQKSGNWDAYGAKHGKSAKAQARDEAVKTGDWTAYKKQYGVTEKQTPHKYDGKFFKSAESMEKYKRGEFWQKYAAADRAARKQLLKENPQFDERSNWTDEQWDTWKTEKKANERTKARGWGSFAANQDRHLAANNIGAATFLRKTAKRAPRIKTSWG